MEMKLEKVVENIVSQNKNILVVYKNEESGQIQFSGDNKWLTSVQSQPELKNQLEETLLENQVFPLIYAKLPFDVSNVRGQDTVIIRKALNKMLRVQGFGRNSTKRYGEGPKPAGWPLDVEWSTFHGSSNSKNMKNSTLAKIIKSLLEHAGYVPREHGTDEVAAQMEENAVQIQAAEVEENAAEIEENGADMEENAAEMEENAANINAAQFVIDYGQGIPEVAEFLVDVTPMVQAALQAEVL